MQFDGLVLLSIDYSKAFDTLSTDSILKAIELYGFGDYFLKWIKIILSGRACSVRNGGYISKEFGMDRWVRQGCPISSILFILTSELFAANIRADPKIKGLKLCYSALITTISYYADDIISIIPATSAVRNKGKGAESKPISVLNQSH